MRWLRACLCVLVGWAPLSAQGAAEMAIIYQQTWQTLQTNTGISDPAEIDFVPHGLIARDASYPEIGLTDTVKVINNGVRNVLDANTDYVVAGVVIDRIGDVAGNATYPNWFNADRRIITYSDWTITTTSINAAIFAPVLEFNLTAGSTDLIQLAISFYGGNYHADLFARRWNESNIATDATTIAKSAMENKRIRFQFDMTPGAMDAGHTTVQDDGTLIVSMIDLDTDVETVLYSYSNTSLYYTTQSVLVPDNNHIACAALGYGLLGQNEQFVIMTPEAAQPADPDPGTLTASTPEPCCGSGGGGSATGPILPAIVPTWEEACTGGGTVPTAADLTDAENWDD